MPTTDRPSKFPRWADVPPAAPPNTITEPLEAQKDVGFQPGNPVRQFFNWLFNLVYLWALWLDQATYRVSDLHPDHALPYGTAPTVGGGTTLVASAADFSGKVYVGGYHVPLTSSPAYTYTNGNDTYWDLGRNGAWTAVPVAHGAGAPALTANSVRVYMITTSGGDRTAFTDFRSSSVRLDKAARFEAVNEIGKTGLTPGTGLYTERNVYNLSASSGKVYQAIRRLAPDTAMLPMRTYGKISGTFVAKIEVFGAFLDPGTDNWQAEATTIYRVDTTGATVALYTMTGVTIGNKYADGAWVLVCAMSGNGFAGPVYNYIVPTTFYRSISGAEYIIQSGTDPGRIGTYATTGLGSLYKPGSGAAVVAYPLHLPHGATLTNVIVNGVFLKGSDSINAFITRVPVGTAAASYLYSGGTSAIPDTSDLSLSHAVDNSIPVDQNNIIDNNAYAYCLTIYWGTTSTLVIPQIRIRGTHTQLVNH